MSQEYFKFNEIQYHKIIRLIRNGKYEKLNEIIETKKDELDLSFGNNDYIIQACARGYEDIVKLLLEDKNVDPSDQKNTAIIEASRYGHYKIVKLLLQHKNVNPVDRNNKAIIEASRFGNLDVVKLLIPKVDPSDQDNEAIIQACSFYDNIEIVNLLLEDPRVNPTVRGHYAINFASYNKCIDIVRSLLRWYAKNNIPVENFIKILYTDHKPLILMYYDINDIAENLFDQFHTIHQNSMYIEILLTRYHKGTYKRQILLKLLDRCYDNNMLTQILCSKKYCNLPRSLAGIIAGYLE